LFELPLFLFFLLLSDIRAFVHLSLCLNARLCAIFIVPLRAIIAAALRATNLSFITPLRATVVALLRATTLFLLFHCAQ
jgi:hypothetical protein